MYLLSISGGYKSYRNGDIISQTLEKAEFTTSIRHIARLLKSRMPKSRIRLGEKREGEEEHGQLQSVLHFTQQEIDDDLGAFVLNLQIA